MRLQVGANALTDRGGARRLFEAACRATAHGRWDLMRGPRRHRACQESREVRVPDLPFLPGTAHHAGLMVGHELERNMGLGLAFPDRLPGPHEPGPPLVEEKLARWHAWPLVLRHLTFRRSRQPVNSPKFDAVEDVDRGAQSDAGCDMIAQRHAHAFLVVATRLHPVTGAA